jgi:hypothetical protein
MAIITNPFSYGQLGGAALGSVATTTGTSSSWGLYQQDQQQQLNNAFSLVWDSELTELVPWRTPMPIITLKQDRAIDRLRNEIQSWCGSVLEVA